MTRLGRSQKNVLFFSFTKLLSQIFKPQNTSAGSLKIKITLSEIPKFFHRKFDYVVNDVTPFCVVYVYTF